MLLSEYAIVEAEKKEHFSPIHFLKYLTGEQLGIFILPICNLANCQIMVYDVKKCIGGCVMTRDEFEDNCWRYYKLLEKSFVEIMTYVELDTRNYDTFSYEFVRQLQGIGAEIDSVMKVICGFNSSDRKNTNDYCPIILGKYTDITTNEINVQNIVIKPFENWNAQNPTSSLFWYEAYNEIKHGRTGDFTKANLKNVLYALAGLYLLEMHYFQEVAQQNESDIPNRGSEIFNIRNWQTRCISLDGAIGFT